MEVAAGGRYCSMTLLQIGLTAQSGYRPLEMTPWWGKSKRDEEVGPMAEHSPIDRRSFLVGGIKAGIGLGLGARTLRRETSTGRRPGDVVNQPGPAPVATQPLIPPNFARYVSRPDLTPVPVAVNATPGFLALGSKPGYIFCAAEGARGGQPRKWDAGRSWVLPVRRHPGPDDIGHTRRAGLVQAAARAR